MLVELRVCYEECFWGGVSVLAPVVVRVSAPLFPSMFVCPFIHLKEVLPPLFLSLFTIGPIIFASEVFTKSESVIFSILSRITFIAH